MEQITNYAITIKLFMNRYGMKWLNCSVLLYLFLYLNTYPNKNLQSK